MAANFGYVVNEDGSVTRIGGRSSSNNNNNNPNNNSNDPSGNSGCIWGVLIAIAIIVIVVIMKSNSSASSDYDYNDTVAVVEEAEDVVAEEISVPSTTYLRVSDDDIYMDSQGGTVEISISTDGDWYVSVNPESWGYISKSTNFLTLRLDRNNSSSTRTDYFEIKSGDLSRRINITQYGNANPSGSITRVWVEHNVYHNGAKGMKIHATYDVENMKDKYVYMYTYFYYEDNSTPLKDPYGNNLSMSSSGVAQYENTTFNDTWHFIPYTNLNMQPGYSSINLSFDVSIKDGNGNQLDRDENNRFTLNEN